MVEKQKKSQNKVLNKDMQKYLENCIKENFLLIMFFITPLVIQFTDRAHWMKTVLLIISLVGLIAMSQKWKSLSGTFIILLTIIITAKYLITLSSQKLILGNMLGLGLLFLLWNTIILVFTVLIYKNKYENNKIIKL